MELSPNRELLTLTTKGFHIYAKRLYSTGCVDIQSGANQWNRYVFQLIGPVLVLVPVPPSLANEITLNAASSLPALQGLLQRISVNPRLLPIADSITSLYSAKEASFLIQYQGLKLAPGDDFESAGYFSIATTAVGGDAKVVCRVASFVQATQMVKLMRLSSLDASLLHTWFTARWLNDYPVNPVREGWLQIKWATEDTVHTPAWQKMWVRVGEGEVEEKGSPVLGKCKRLLLECFAQPKGRRLAVMKKLAWVHGLYSDRPFWKPEEMAMFKLEGIILRDDVAREEREFFAICTAESCLAMLGWLHALWDGAAFSPTQPSSSWWFPMMEDSFTQRSDSSGFLQPSDIGNIPVIQGTGNTITFQRELMHTMQRRISAPPATRAKKKVQLSSSGSDSDASSGSEKAKRRPGKSSSSAESETEKKAAPITNIKKKQVASSESEEEEEEEEEELPKSVGKKKQLVSSESEEEGSQPLPSMILNTTHYTEPREEDEDAPLVTALRSGDSDEDVPISWSRHSFYSDYDTGNSTLLGRAHHFNATDPSQLQHHVTTPGLTLLAAHDLARAQASQSRVSGPLVEIKHKQGPPVQGLVGVIKQREQVKLSNRHNNAGFGRVDFDQEKEMQRRHLVQEEMWRRSQLVPDQSSYNIHPSPTLQPVYAPMGVPYGAAQMGAYTYGMPPTESALAPNLPPIRPENLRTSIISTVSSIAALPPVPAPAPQHSMRTSNLRAPVTPVKVAYDSLSSSSSEPDSDLNKTKGKSAKKNQQKKKEEEEEDEDDSEGSLDADIKISANAAGKKSSVAIEMVTEATTEMVELFERFVDARLEMKPYSYLGTNALYEAYRLYCLREGSDKCVAPGTLEDLMQENGYLKKQRKVKGKPVGEEEWYNIILADQD